MPEVLHEGHDHSEDGTWVYAAVGSDMVVLRRETGQSWRWPWDSLRLVAMSQGHFLFEERARSKERSVLLGEFSLVNYAMEEVGRFSVETDDQYAGAGAHFSPDGQALVINVQNTVYYVTLASLSPVAIVEPESRDGWSVSAGAYIFPKWLVGYPYLPDKRGFFAFIRYERKDKNSGNIDTEEETYYFSWDGVPVSEFCPGVPSPDGRYVAQSQGEHYYAKHAGWLSPERPWPSVVFANAETCEPIFRVRSAYAYEVFWHGQWLSNSQGFVVAVENPAKDGNSAYAIVHIKPEPDIVQITPSTSRWNENLEWPISRSCWRRVLFCISV